ncbi:sugar nucleotide-binding protein [Nonomuraea wenchangensis]|uniref:sugar nucleotide-binding protein n=1 Tax=Nonomuraea wenchangensis TaxID=568860 RepID=UPI003716B113
MRVTVVGGGGFLGGELVRQAAAAGHRVAATCFSRPGRAAAEWRTLDVRDRAAVAAVLAALRPDVVVNAAYRQDDWATTATGAAHVALACAAQGARLVHVSSDAVFSGSAVTYAEDAEPDPISPYGAAKAAAEVAVRAVDPAAAVVRTSLIIGDGGSPQEARVHALATGRADGVLFTDDVRCPVHVRDLAAALLELAASGSAGVHHVAGPDAVSRHELGCLIARRDGLDPARLPAGLRAGSGVPGPADVRLDCTATRRLLSTRLRGAREFLREGTPSGPAG